MNPVEELSNPRHVPVVRWVEKARLAKAGRYLMVRLGAASAFAMRTALFVEAALCKAVPFQVSGVVNAHHERHVARA
ncbi:hypothetical protein LRH25_23190 [Ideonella azotifigens]|uniref:Uncharacterized protein n=1 Tax=Ideonella azotifigens TaxID=513160 RepID=A0ABN1JVX9_9BURK|nr:hypothetical protein [Ideonella azotifigens]MCD2343234.1 hypothetical protein [Ideonella azotifigens]